jgi:hypothetical protein
MIAIELFILETAHDITLATDAGLLDGHPDECGQCDSRLTVPFTVCLGEDDISVSRCMDCVLA